MEKTIEIEGREIIFRADGNLGRLYRHTFDGKDIFVDFNKLQRSIGEPPEGYEKYAKSVIKSGKQGKENSLYKDEFEEYGRTALDNLDQDMLENLAYIMAKKADASLPDIDEWLSTFESIISIYVHYAEIMELMQKSMLATVKPKNA